ncbi:MAG: glycosyltransferase family 8 protein [Synergistaceae bacterium]|nr:glycosyltransferase family 8 protein [Synergistaceae bacterium]
MAVYDPLGTYSRYAGVVMTSLFSNTQNKVHVTILHDATLTDDNRHRFEHTAERWQQSVSFIDVSERVFRISGNPDKITRILSRGTLYRLLIPELFNLPKAIYLDCDIVVNLDLSDLWATPIDNFSLAAAKDQLFATSDRRSHEKIRTWAMRYIPENYFNAGVLLMNLQRIRRKYDLVRDGFDFFKRYAHVADFADQDFLNVLFAGEVYFLEARFNRMLNYHDIRNSILHFAGGQQPWKIPPKIPGHFLYWKVFMESEWSDQFGDALAEVCRNKPIELYYSKECLKLLLYRIAWHLRLNKSCDFCKELMLVVKEFCLQIKTKM